MPHDAKVWRHAQLAPGAYSHSMRVRSDIYVTGKPNVWLGHLGYDHRLQATSENKREDRELISTHPLGDTMTRVTSKEE